MTLIKAHTSIIGDTGYNCHSRNFFKALNKLTPVSVRNWTIGDSWKGYNDEPHNGEYYMDDELKSMLGEQTLGTQNGHKEFPLYLKYPIQSTEPVVNIVLNDTGHLYFSQDYSSPSIAYNVWETTRQPEDFFAQLKKFDQVWVPSEWQKHCTIEQGIAPHKVKVVPEGVDTEMFQPASTDSSFPENRAFRFVVVGRWEYRKSTKEIIKAFTETFSEDENVELILSVDNRFATDGLSSTEERLAKFGISHAGIKVLHHQSKQDYVNLLKSADVFVSCARSEGWNLPLIEAMACGVPSMYSNWGAQLQFAQGKGIPVSIISEVPAGVANEESWNQNAPGNFCEPDFTDLGIKLRLVYDKYEHYKKSALMESEQIRNEFTWQNAAKIAQDHIQELVNPKSIEYSTDFAWVTCGNLAYMPIIEKLVISLAKFSNRKIIVYGIDCEVPFNHPNVIKRSLSIPYHSEHDKWYWKQYACRAAAIQEGFENLVWLDGDIVANYNIDTISKYFSQITNYPIPDVHIQDDFIGFFTRKDGSRGRQLFNQNLCERDGIKRLLTKAHICMYVYNKECTWFFDEILKVYKETPLDQYEELLQWNDEGIDNYLRSKHNFTNFLPISNFDVSEWDGDLLGTTGKAMEHFISFWRESGPKNFGKIFGWQFIPKDKSNILYFHGNKELGFATVMTDYIETQRDKNFHDTEYFFVGKNEIKNLGAIKDIPGGTMDIAHSHGWDYAIYHEIYNLKDYEHGEVRVQPGDVVVDLGGNLGIFTRYAYHMGASKIVTFEPDRRYFEILKQNAPENAVLFNAAIADNLGTLTLTESSHLGGSNLWHHKDPLQTQYDVNLYTLDFILENKLIDRIDFLKVDIEGSEIIALKGISDENLSKIRNIAVEYHHEHLGFDEELRNTFVSRLNSLGFNSYMLMCGYNNALQLIYFWK